MYVRLQPGDSVQSKPLAHGSHIESFFYLAQENVTFNQIKRKCYKVVFSFHPQYVGRVKGNAKRKCVLLKRGQLRSQECLCPKVRQPANLSWSSEEFFQLLKSMYSICVF